MASYVRFNGLFPVASQRSTVNAQMYTDTHIHMSACLSLSSFCISFFSIAHTLTLPGPDINQYDSKCKENIDPKHTEMMKAFICSAWSAMICEWTILFEEKMEVN